MRESTVFGLGLANIVLKVHPFDAPSVLEVREQLHESQVIAYFVGLSLFPVRIKACARVYHSGPKLLPIGHKVLLQQLARRTDQVEVQKSVQPGRS